MCIDELYISHFCVSFSYTQKHLDIDLIMDK